MAFKRGALIGCLFMIIGGCSQNRLANPVPTRPTRATIAGQVTFSSRPFIGARVWTAGDTATTDSVGRYCLQAPAHTLVRIWAWYEPAVSHISILDATAQVMTGESAGCDRAVTLNLVMVEDPI